MSLFKPRKSTAPPAPLKFCIECRWFEPYPVSAADDAYFTLAKCLKSPCLTSLVDGKARQDRRFCDNERLPHGACGLEARNFEPKPGLTTK